MSLTALIQSVTVELDRNDAESLPVERRIAALLPPLLAQPDLLAGVDIRFDPKNYSVTLLHVAPEGRFSVCAIAWMPGQWSRIHDHRAWCALGVIEGAGAEEFYRLRTRVTQNGAADPIAETTGGRALSQGMTSFAAPGPHGVHRIGNPGPQPMLSLHLYGCNLAECGTSVDHCFDA
jgi:predicted metal-dependent enzyme (double-stranded beta helix superfamily)